MLSQRSKTLIFIAIVICYFSLRLVNLGILPIFTDEAEYLHWVKLLRGGLNNLWITYESESKKPLTAWLTYPFYGLFKDPLVSCRFGSVIFGFAAFLATFWLALRMFNWRVAHLTAFLYATCPFMVFHERMFLMDHLITLFATLFLVFLVRAAQNDRTKDYAWSGFFLGLATANKEIALLYLIMSLFAFRLIGQHRLNAKIFITIFMSIATPLAMSIIPHFKFGARLSHVGPGYMIPLQTLLSNPIPSWLRNVKFVLTPYLLFLGPLVIVTALGLIRMVGLKEKRAAFLLVCSFFVPLALIFCVERWGSRYLLFVIPPTLIFASWAVVEGIRSRLIKYGLVAITVCYFLAFDLLLIFYPPLAPLPQEDRRQYITGWPAGYGLDKAVSFLNSEAEHGVTDVFLPPIFGNPTDSLFVYLGDNENIRLHIAWWLEEKPILREGCLKIQSNPHTRRYTHTVCFDKISHAYFVADPPQFKIEPVAKFNPNMKPVLIAQKPENKSAFVVFKLR